VALMAIVKNDAFKGSPVYDLDSGAPTLARSIKHAQGDVAGTLAHLTDSTDPLHIDHSGGARGALLGIPWVSQNIDITLSLDAGGAKNGGDTTVPQLFPYLLRIPPGEDGFVVEVAANLINAPQTNPRVRVSLKTDFTAPGSSLGLDFPLTGVPSLIRDDIDTDRPTIFAARITGLLADFVIVTLMFDYSGGGSVGDVVIRSLRDPVDVRVPVAAAANVAGVVAPTSTAALFHQPMDETIFADGEGLTGWHTSRIDRNVNGLLEFSTASPAGKNPTYTHTESALRNPTRDRFRAFTRKTFALEPIPVIPIASVNFGGINSSGYLVDPANGTSVATRRGYAPYPTSAGGSEVASMAMHMPDVPTTPSVLQWAVLLGQSDTTSFGWTNVRCNVAVESLAASPSVTPTPVANSPFALAEGSALAFARDSAANRFRVLPSQVAGAFDRLNYCVLAAAVRIEE
jgi:hypothetical protein